jgi:phosphoglycolate phosphatase
MIKAVIFDFDGVLFDTFDINLAICREQNKNIDIETFKKHHDGNVYEEPAIKFTEEDVVNFWKKYHDRADAEHFFPLIDQIENLFKKYKLFIVSSSTEKTIEKYLSLTKIETYFQKVLGAETDKSKVKKLGIIFKEFDLKPEECAFIVDTLGDILEGKKSGVHTVAVTWGYHEEERLKKGNPDFIISEFNKLESVIEQFNGKK